MPRDRGLAETLHVERGQRISLTGGDLEVFQWRTLLGGRIVSVPDRPFSWKRVLHLMVEFAEPIPFRQPPRVREHSLTSLVLERDRYQCGWAF